LQASPKNIKEEPKVTNGESMAALVEEYGDKLVPFKAGETTEVVILEVTPRKVIVDVAGLAIGVIPEREYSFDTNELKPGDKVSAYVLATENVDGNVILSFKRADREGLWDNLTEKFEKGEIVPVKVIGANRGGLLVECGGLDGFIPVSQLSPEHYPRVEGGSGTEIARRLQGFIGQALKTKILSLDKQTDKLIFSEKMLQGLLQETAVEQVKLGDTLEGTITGIVQFGLFVNADGVEGLVHISEISWDKVVSIDTLYQVGQHIKVKVVQIDGNRVSFSIKRLQSDPWMKAYEEFKPGSEVEGEVTRITAFGAFVKITEHVAGLCHVSQMGEGIQNVTDVLTLGQKYKFKVLNVEPATHRCSLQLITSETAGADAAVKPKPKKATAPAETAEAKPKAEDDTEAKVVEKTEPKKKTAKTTSEK